MRSSHLTRFREAGGRTPVLVLTARDEVKDRVRGFASDTNVVDVHVRRLRSKVDHPLPLKMIRIACGSGYVLESKQ